MTSEVTGDRKANRPSEEPGYSRKGANPRKHHSRVKVIRRKFMAARGFGVLTCGCFSIDKLATLSEPVMPEFFNQNVIDLLFTWGPPILWLSGGVVVGLVVERVAMTRLRAWSEQSKWAYDHIIIAGVKGLAFFWCVLLGLFMATQCLVLRAEWQATVSKALIVALMFSLTVATARVVGGLLAHNAKRSGGAVASSIITNLAAVVIYILGFLVILDSVGVQITPILTALGVGGLAVALALQDTLSNLFAGLQLVASKKINIGDYVRLDNTDEGVITDLTWRYTTVCTLAGNLVIVPNAKLSSAIVTNYSLPQPEIPVSVPISVAYSSDLERIEHISIEVAQGVQATVDGAVRDFQPLVRFTAFGEWSVNFNLVLRATSFEQQPVVRHELIKRLHARFAAEGIDIPYPTRTLHLKNSTQVPT